MIAPRGRRVGAVLLVVWLLADTCAFAFCGPQLLVGLASTHVSAGDGSDASPSTDQQCFCCSQVEEVVRFELHFREERVTLVGLKQLRPPDISIRNSSPPPRF